MKLVSIQRKLVCHNNINKLFYMIFHVKTECRLLVSFGEIFDNILKYFDKK